MIYSMIWETETGNYGSVFAPLTSNPFETQISEFWKNEKKTGDIIILHKCIINDNHMMYSFWDMKRDRHIFLPFWAIFCSFTPLTIQKMKILKNGKTPGDIIILHKCTKNHDYMLYCSWDMVCDWCNSHFSFWAFLHPFTPLNSPKNKNYNKMKKKCRSHKFIPVYRKSWLYAILFLKYGVWLM